MTTRELLWDIALDQHGFVTVDDALAAGLSRNAVDLLVRRGTLVSAATGVYRFPGFPETPQAPYMLAVLWARTPGACLSHDTALSLHELCDINPDRVHLTVPPARRIRRAGGELYVVHREDLLPEQIGWWELVPITDPATAIRQGIHSGVPSYLLRQALDRGRRTGQLTVTEHHDLTNALEARGGGS